MMKIVKYTFYVVLLILPFLFMVLVNEKQQVKNSSEKNAVFCTWHCHNDTEYCIKNHNKIIKGKHLTFTNQIYNSIIHFLSTVKGGYQAMNILFLVVFVPFVMWLLLIGAIEKYLKIRKLGR